MTDNKVELTTLFKKMLDDVDDLLKTDDILKEDVKDYNMKIQWFMNGIKGYQIFEGGNYSHAFGEVLGDPDLTLEFADNDMPLRLLKNELDEYTYTYYKRKFKLYYPERRETIQKETGPIIVKHLKPILIARYTKGIQYHPFVLSKLPIFRTIVEKFYEPETVEGSYIPINTTLGTYDNQMLPEKLIEHFINKASTFYIQEICGCRVFRDCKDHEKSIGCMYIGEDVKNLKHPFEKGRFVSREEAMNHAKKGIANGLIPTFGRFAFESTSLSVEDTGHFMSMCFCCHCCCINGKLMQNATSELQDLFKRMEGLTVEVDPDICVGCRECLKVCCFVSRNIIDGKAVIDQNRCLGCGRCEKVCPNNAITITLDDPKRLDEFIQRIENSVDVS